MRRFKIIDISISVTLIVLFIILIIKGELDNEYYMAYMTVGAWQLISMFIHLLKKWCIAKTCIRYWYHRLVAYYIPSLWLLALLLSFLPFELRELIMQLTMGTTSSIMALSYIVICYIEWTHSKPRLMAKLKH